MHVTWTNLPTLSMRRDGTAVPSFFCHTLTSPQETQEFIYIYKRGIWKYILNKQQSSILSGIENAWPHNSP